MIALGGEAIERFAQDLREVSGMTIGVSQEGYNAVKEMVRDFKAEVADFVNKENKPVEIVGQLNFQLFPLTKNAEEKPENRGNNNE